MKLITAIKDGDLLARLTGDIDHHSAAGIREEIDRLLAVGLKENELEDIFYNNAKRFLKL